MLTVCYMKAQRQQTDRQIKTNKKTNKKTTRKTIRKITKEGEIHEKATQGVEWLGVKRIENLWKHRRREP